MSDIDRHGRTPAPGQPDPTEADRPKSGYVVVPREEPGSRLNGTLAMLLLAGTVALVLVVAWGLYPDFQQQVLETPAETSPVAGEPLEGAPQALGAPNTFESSVPTSAPEESPAPSSAAAPASSTENVDAAYVVQVGAFRNFENAERLQASLNAQDLEATVSLLPTDLHAVDVGPFPDRSAADTVAAQVTELTGLTPLVIRNTQ